MAFSRAQRARANQHENGYREHPSETAQHPRLYRAHNGSSAAAADEKTRAAGGTGSGALGRYHRISVGLAASDAVCIVVALVSAYFLRYSDRPMPTGEIAVIVLTPVLWVGVFQAFDLYAIQHLAAPEEFRRIIGASSVGIVLLALASYWSHSSLSRAWVGLTWAVALALELLTRRCWRAWVWRLRVDGRLALRTLVLGTSAEAKRLVEILRAPGSGFLPLGYARALDPGRPAGSANSLPVFGGIDELDRLVREQDVDCLFVASTGISLEDMSRVSQTARRAGIEVRVLANLPLTLTSRLSLLKVGPAIALALKPVRLSGRQAAMKRAFDLVVASAALMLTAPLWVVIAVAIRLDSRGPVFFSQERVTKDGRIFRMHKFRSMRTGADAALDTTRPFFKLQSDPRLTRSGAFLRRFSLDELPQFWNVITGDMSIVGPRPLPADQVAANPELLSPRHVVPAGVTGWWQTNGRSRVTPEEALRLDLFYIENWSLPLDLYVVMKTFGAVLGRQGAF
jgi:exopolysaccharide biosynthesis polyprenyl glycosylphosphotransferase